MDSGSQQKRPWWQRENPFFLAMFMGIFLSPLLAISLPEEIFMVWHWTKPFADFMAGLIPSIERLTELSKFPQVTRLFMSLQWAVWGPVCIWTLVKFGQPTEEKMSNMLRILQARWWYVLFFPLIAAIGIWFFLFFPFPAIGSGTTPFDKIIHWMSESRLWLGMFGSLFVTSTAIVITGFFRSYTLIRLAYTVRESSPFYRKRKERK